MEILANVCRPKVKVPATSFGWEPWLQMTSASHLTKAMKKKSQNESNDHWKLIDLTNSF